MTQKENRVIVIGGDYKTENISKLMNSTTSYEGLIIILSCFYGLNSTLGSGYCDLRLPSPINTSKYLRNNQRNSEKRLESEVLTVRRAKPTAKIKKTFRYHAIK